MISAPTVRDGTIGRDFLFLLLDAPKLVEDGEANAVARRIGFIFLSIIINLPFAGLLSYGAMMAEMRISIDLHWAKFREVIPQAQRALTEILERPTNNRLTPDEAQEHIYQIDGISRMGAYMISTLIPLEFTDRANPFGNDYAESRQGQLVGSNYYWDMELMSRLTRYAKAFRTFLVTGGPRPQMQG